MSIPVTAVRMDADDKTTWESAREFARTLPWHCWIHKTRNGNWGVWA